MNDINKHDIKENLKQQSTWIRGLFMLLFSIFYVLAEILLVIVVVFQFLLKLLTGEVNGRLLKLGQSLATYIYQIIQFVTFNSDNRPFPYGPWPKGQPPKSTNKQRQQSTLENSADSA